MALMLQHIFAEVRKVCPALDAYNVERYELVNRSQRKTDEACRNRRSGKLAACTFADCRSALVTGAQSNQRSGFARSYPHALGRCSGA